MMPASDSSPLPPAPRRIAALRRWFDTQSPDEDQGGGDRIDWLRAVPFVGLHLACLAMF